MPMVEDFSAFLDVDELAHQAVLDSVEVAGIFDNGPRDAMSGLGGGVAVADPTFALPSAACTRVRAGTSRLRVVGVGTYTVEAIEPDGTGMTLLRLRLITAAS